MQTKEKYFQTLLERKPKTCLVNVIDERSFTDFYNDHYDYLLLKCFNITAIAVFKNKKFLFIDYYLDEFKAKALFFINTTLHNAKSILCEINSQNKKEYAEWLKLCLEKISVALTESFQPVKSLTEKY